MGVSIVLPAYNEERLIRKNLLRIMNIIKKIEKNYEIIVVEESTDKTPVIVNELAKKYKKIVHLHFANRLGKGGAIKEGVKAARYETVAFMDIDLSTSLSALAPLLQGLQAYDIVVGSRYHPMAKIKRTKRRFFLSIVYSKLCRLFLGLKIRDPQVGFKGFKRSAFLRAIKPVKNLSFFWDTEFLFYAQKMGFKIKEIPIEWREASPKITTVYYMIFSFLKFFLRILRYD